MFGTAYMRCAGTCTISRDCQRRCSDAETVRMGTRCDFRYYGRKEGLETRTYRENAGRELAAVAAAGVQSGRKRGLLAFVVYHTQITYEACNAQSWTRADPQWL